MEFGPTCIKYKKLNHWGHPQTIPPKCWFKMAELFQRGSLIFNDYLLKQGRIYTSLVEISLVSQINKIINLV
jgi:hypothetical protein